MGISIGRQILEDIKQKTKDSKTLKNSDIENINKRLDELEVLLKTLESGLSNRCPAFKKISCEAHSKLKDNK